MNSIDRLPIATGNVASRDVVRELSLLRLYTLRVAYFIMAAGLGAFI